VSIIPYRDGMAGSFSLQRTLVFCTLGIVILILLRCKYAKDCNALLYGYAPPSVAPSPAAPPTVHSNRLTYVYVVGVEGVGHHGVVPAIAEIGKACDYHVVYEHKLLRQFQNEHKVENFRSILEVSKHVKAPLPDVLVVEDASFPSGGHSRNVSYVSKKASGRYDLEWIYDQISAVGGINVRFLYLSRDFYRAVASHPEFDGGFTSHAEVMHDYMQFIESEYKLIERKRQGLWRQIRYEWFTELSDCPSLVGNIAAFLDLEHCDVEQACRRIASTVRKERAIVVNETEKAIARSYQLDVSIPVLPYVL
jgi:hypothetical protein